MTQKELAPRLKKWAELHDEAKEITDNLYKYLGIEVGAKQLDILWKVFEEYTKVLSELIGDDAKWLEWYYGENDMGKRELGARKAKGCKLRKVKTLEDLAYFFKTITEPKPKTTPKRR